jgi:hypothetical protein
MENTGAKGVYARYSSEHAMAQIDADATIKKGNL